MWFKYTYCHILDSSHRISQRGGLLFPPYVQFGWDQKALKLENLKSNPQEVAHFNHIVGYGRPLFVSLYSPSRLY